VIRACSPPLPLGKGAVAADREGRFQQLQPMVAWSGNFADQFKLICKVADALGGGGDQHQWQHQRGWLCRREGCQYAVNKWKNSFGSTHCWGCKTAKALATKKKPDEATTVPGADKEKDAGQKKREKRAAKRKAQAEFKTAKAGNSSTAPPPSPPATTAPAPEPVAAPQGPAPVAVGRLAFPDEFLETIPLLSGPLLDYFVDSLRQEHAPPDQPAKDPESIVRKFLGAKGPTAATEKIAGLEVKIDKIKIAISALDGLDFMADEKRKAEAELELLSSQLAKSTKAAPSPGYEEKAHVEAKSSYAVAMQVRKDRANAGAEKARMRKQERLARFNDAKKQMDAMYSVVERLISENDQKFNQKALEATLLDDEVMELFDTKIAALKASVAPAPASAPAAAAAGSAALPPHHPEPPAAPASTGTEPLQELAIMKQKCEHLTAELAKESRKITQFGMTYEDVGLCNLPEVEVPAPEAHAAFESLYQTLEDWDSAGQSMPFTWEVLTSVTADGPAPMDMCKSLMGAAWTKWFSEGDPHPTSIVPRQVASLVRKNLGRLKTKFSTMDVQQEAKRRSEEGMAAIRDCAKKIRSQ